MKNYKRQILLFLYISMAIVIGSFSVLFTNFRKQGKLQNEVLQIEKNLIQTDSLTNNLLQLESDKRGFQLTSDVDFLKNYYRIKMRCNRNIASLMANTADIKIRAVISQVDSLIKLRIGNLDSGIVVFTTQGEIAATEFMQLKSKKLTRELLGQQLDFLKNNFLQLLEANTSGINTRTTRNIGGLLTLVLIFILLMLVAARTFRRAQQKIIQNHLKFKEAQRIARIGSWEWEIATDKLKWSQEQFRIFGEDRKTFDLTCKSYLAHLSGEEQIRTRSMIADAIEGKTSFSVEHEIVRKDGIKLMVFEQGTVLYDEKGKPAGMFGTTQDISDRKKTEEELQIAQKKFKAIFDHTANGIYQSTMDGKFVMANASMARIFGYDSPEELIRSVTDISSQIYADAADRERMSELISSQGHIENFELQVLTKSKVPIWVSANIRIVKDEKDGFSYFEGVLEDISDRKKAEGEILQLNKNLEQFANITAHDLQEPIRMVSGFLGLLDKKYGNSIDEQGKSYIHRAKDGADRMSILIRDLLEFSRSANKAAKMEPVDLRYVLDLVHRDMSIVIEDTSANLLIPNSLPVVEGTQSALYRLFLNLVSNGIKFRKKDTAPEVSISMQETAESWEFTVQDNGIGVPEKDQPKLFHAFQRLHRKEVYPGTGLGLVTCKKIVETHGGRIWITSECGKGTGFHFTLPKMRA